jgi:hypothetical protein
MEEKVELLIEKLMKIINDGEIAWERVSNSSVKEKNNIILRNFLMFKEVKGDLKLNKFLSRYTKIDDGYVYVFVYSFNEFSIYIIGIQSDISSNITEINTEDTHQEELKKIISVIDEKTDKTEKYVDKLIEKLNKLM